MKEFLTFQRFKDEHQADELIALLNKNNIEHEVKTNFNDYDVATFTKNEHQNEISILLLKEDFEFAHDVLIQETTAQIDKISVDYYLFEFTDEDLIEIVSKPDEWGHFDYCLSLKILKQRGKEINLDLARTLRKNRVEELSRPETGVKVWIIFGYFSALIGGFLGIIMGIHIATNKKILPNGDKVYTFSEGERKHGFVIVILGFVCLLSFIIIRVLFENW